MEVVAGELDTELLKNSQTSIGVAWQDASCQGDLNHPDCRVCAWSPNPQAEIWEQRYYWHTVKELCMLAIQWEELEYLAIWIQDIWIKR